MGKSKVFDFGRLDDGGCFIVFELVTGGHLGTEIRKGPLSVERAVDVMIQLSQAVHHAHHEKNLFHRDLKPSNILIAPDGRPLITDFGLAISDEQQLQTRGEISGTLAYMSPEQTRGESHLLDGRSDIWSLGVIFYELLTGKRPFNGITHDQVFEQIQHREPRPLRQIDDSIPHTIERICLRCLRRNEEHRYQVASDLASDLRSARPRKTSARLLSGQ
jgi:serine/threonine protein kinase